MKGLRMLSRISGMKHILNNLTEDILRSENMESTYVDIAYAQRKKNHIAIYRKQNYIEEEIERNTIM